MQTHSRTLLRLIAGCLLSASLLVSMLVAGVSTAPQVRGATMSTPDYAGYTLLISYHSTKTIRAVESVPPVSLTYRAGYSRQGSWLCYGWPSGYYRCTQYWHISNSRLVSDHPAWVPNGLSDVQPIPPTANPPTTQPPINPPGVLPPKNTALQPCSSAIVWPSHITAWTVPSGCYGRIFYPNLHNYVVRPSYGWCNWWPEVLHPWLGGSDALHLPSHSRPVAGAVVYFAPGVQGASSVGHYAQVVAIAPGGYWLLITEMNFLWRGGGWARVDYRFVHLGAGVSFRYN